MWHEKRRSWRADGRLRYAHVIPGVVASQQAVEAGVVATPDDLGHTRKVELSTVTAEISGSHTGFPVLFTVNNLPPEMFDADGSTPAQAGGGDIRFTSDAAGTSLLPCEIVVFLTDPDPVNGYAEIWVKLPDVRDSQTDNVWCWYSTPGADSQPAVTEPHGRNAVWSDYAMVTHDCLTDSAGNHTLTPTGTAAGTNPWGRTDGARGFGGVVGVGSTDKVTTDLTAHSDQTTIHAWLNRGGPGGSNQGRIFDKRTGGIQVALWYNNDGTGRYELHRQFSGGQGQWGVSRPVTTGLWELHVVSLDVGDPANDAAMYRDGTALALNLNVNTTGSALTNADGYVIGNRGNDNARTWAGLIAEFRVYHGLQTAGWIATEGRNQLAPGSFISVGTPVNV